MLNWPVQVSLSRWSWYPDSHEHRAGHGIGDMVALLVEYGWQRCEQPPLLTLHSDTASTHIDTDGGLASKVPVLLVPHHCLQDDDSDQNFSVFNQPWCYFFFLMVHLETDYLRTPWTNLHQNFRIGTRTYGCAWDVAMVTDFWRKSAKMSGRWHSTKDGKITKWMRGLTPPIIALHRTKIWQSLVQ